jgi:plastocyanin
LEENMKRALLCPVVTVVAALACLAAPGLASAATHKSGTHKRAKTLCCLQHLHFAAGPYHVKPGSNSIFISYANVPKPNHDGYLIEMVPNLHYAKANGKCCGPLPQVSILHLHHGVWLSNGMLGAGEGNGNYGGIGYPFMATGEEKTRYILPPGYGYPVQGKDHWSFNYMIHDLIPQPATVYVTYEVYFVPANSPLAKTITAVHPIWMDVEDHQLYPVFNVMKGSGKNGKFTFPYMANKPYGIRHPLNQFTVDQPGTLVATAGHVHPGGLFTELDDTRAGTARSHGALAGIAPGSVRLFRSNAHYWDKRGPISWDMAMQGTAPDWRPHINTGDTLSVSATYDTKLASWYEAMGIMVVWEAWDSQRGIDVFTGKPQSHVAAKGVSGMNPFVHKLDQKGYLTHGRLLENEDNGGTSTQYNVNLKKLKPCQSNVVDVNIHHFAYNPGGFSSTLNHTCIPTIKAGTSLTFVNQDAPDTAQGFLFPDTPYGDAIFHSVTSCAKPCELNSAISYPLANVADLVGGYDSGQLGIGTPGTGKLTWSTPSSLKPGLYTYFCRIHPFMRGVFRIVG